MLYVKVLLYFILHFYDTGAHSRSMCFLCSLILTHLLLSKKIWTKHRLVVNAVKHFTGCNSRGFNHATTRLLRLGTLMPALSQTKIFKTKIITLRLKWCRKYDLWKCVLIQQEAWGPTNIGLRAAPCIHGILSLSGFHIYHKCGTLSLISKICTSIVLISTCIHTDHQKHPTTRQTKHVLA